jgi:ABC-type glutathione transport system ATPase component
MTSSPAAISLHNIVKTYPFSGKSLFGIRSASHHALRGITMDVYAGETFAIVGESGSGKSTLARIVAKLNEPTSGEVIVDGIRHRDRRGRSLAALRRSIQLIQQDTRASLDPRMSIGKQLIEILSVHNIGSRRDRPAIAIDALRDVGLSSEIANRLPGMLSGGQRQRVVIARALLVDPAVLVCDEPVSSLDAATQVQIIDLLQSVQSRRKITLLFITHDLALAERISDRVGVMHDGAMVELGPTSRVFEAPTHSYTRDLLAASVQY